MKEMTKKEKFKKFVYDHRETIAQVTVYTTLIVGAIAIIAKESARQQQAASDAISDHNSWVEEENEWIDDQYAADKVVYLLHDLTYLLVPKDTETEWIGDRKPKK
jgi:hypothetical protein